MTPESAGRIVHVAGLVVNIGSLRRQRCAWCGIPIEDVDLAQVATSTPGPLPTWPVGALIAFDGAGRYVVQADVTSVDGHELVQLPEDCCAKLPAELTR